MNKSIPVSVIIMTKNEEQNIGKCLRSVRDFDQVFVVDSNSDDRTTEIANSLGATVINFTWNHHYPKKKQWVLENLPFSHDWVLYVDADEEVYPELAEEIRRLLRQTPKHSGYFVGYDYIFMGRVLKRGHRVYKLVLMRRHQGKFLDHDDLSTLDMEVEAHQQPRIDGTTGALKSRMVHNDHDSLYAYFERHNRYSEWEADLRARGKLINSEEAHLGMRLLQKRLFGALPLKGLVAFFHAYVFKLGFLDGRAGLDYALARALYYWQVGIKLKEIAHKEARANEREVIDRELKSS